MKRAVSFITAFLVMLFLLVALWSHRFAATSDSRALNLEEMRKQMPLLPQGATWKNVEGNSILVLSRSLEQRAVQLRFELPFPRAVEALHVRCSVAARNLKVGSQKWEDGRIIIEWATSSGENATEVDPICSHRNDEFSHDLSLVAKFSAGLAHPILRVENLGSSGDLVISRLEIVPVFERKLWRIGRWFVLLGSFALLVFFFRSDSTPQWRGLASAGIWLLMVVLFAIPGPWKSLRPLVVDFELGHSREKSEVCPTFSVNLVVDSSSSVESHHKSEVIGDVPDQRGWIVKLKLKLEPLRPLLHALLLFVPALAFSFLIGRMYALQLSCALAVMIEAAQIAFGYGFDWIDVSDLLTDFIGIQFAIWIHRRWFTE